MTVSDKALAQAWRNRFISERMNAYPDDSHEVCRAKAEADANDFEDAFIAASANRARELDAAKGATPPAQAAEAVPAAVQATNPAGGVIAYGDWCINFGTHVRVTNAEFARGWNEARAAIAAIQAGGKGAGAKGGWCERWITREELAEMYPGPTAQLADAMDAERYRWLRTRIAGAEHVSELVEFSQQMHPELPGEVDAAIDAAIQAGE